MALRDYEPVIGLEVHVQLSTATKIFCGCSTKFGDPANTNVCPVCLGLPVALPVMNRKALELATRAALALNIQVQERSRFARKNYFYPDLTKGYQISQYELPLALGGWLEIEVEGAKKRIGITRLHLEEDAGKSMHEGFPESATKSYIDFNRCGTPLVEIVSEPDMRTPAEAYAYLTALKQVLLYAEVSDCNMEEGSLRCDANVSVRKRGVEKFGEKVEVKNLNSFRYLQRALEYEIRRQVEAVESGARILQETRLWNVGAARTEPMRSKEFAHDYRYFPEPDLLPVQSTEQMIAQVRGAMPELPAAKRARFISQYGLTPYDAGVLTDSRALADYFEATMAAGASAKSAAKWTSNELMRRLDEANVDVAATPISPESLSQFIAKVESGVIPAAKAKEIFAELFAGSKSLEEVIALMELTARISREELLKMLVEIAKRHQNDLAHESAGSRRLEGFLFGQIMSETKRLADPQVLRALFLNIASNEANLQVTTEAPRNPPLIPSTGNNSTQSFVGYAPITLSGQKTETLKDAVSERVEGGTQTSRDAKIEEPENGM